ncbi:S1 family peptidase [Streptomyces sp. NPDC057654]|uniref:S1 family peptidase n=1 Tax=Streptomyces sp. NPDC057654 TaxID=3346196 RepID=UPI00367AD226
MGDEVKDGTYAFTAKLDVGSSVRSCSGALVEEQWVITAASCFADTPGAKVVAGAPKQKTTVTVGRADLTGKAGTVADAVELVPREGRDLVMVKLAKPVTGVAPLAVGTDAPRKGEQLRVAGYGRTETAWLPNRLHSASFTVGATDGTTVGLNGKSESDVVCKGDAGSPAFREKDGRLELAAVNSLSWQKGCIGNEGETREGVTDVRVDDVADWIQQVSSRTLLPRANWSNAMHLASGYFTGGSAGGQRHMDLFVVWKDGSASLYRAADHHDRKYPFSREHKVANAGSFWTRARAVTGGSFAGDGSDGITVRWSNGKVSTYTHLDEKGVHDEKVLFDPAPDSYWKRARLITAGRYTDNALRDDLLVLWENGSVSMYTDVGTKGLKGWKQLHDADKSWTNAAQLSSGEFTGKKTADLVIRWKDGDTTIFPGVDTDGFHGRTRIRDVGSPWKNAQVLNVGAFAANVVPNDILIRWNDGNLSYYPGVDVKGTHGEVQLVG